MNPSDWPTPYDLDRTPERAVLTVLDTALHLSVRALVAAHPHLDAQDVSAWCRDRSRPFILARSIVELAQSLAQQVAHYQTLLSPIHPTQDDEIPF